MDRTFDSIVNELRSLRDTGSLIYAVHYACEDFYEVRDKPPGISAIALEGVNSGEVLVYSVIDRSSENVEREKYVLHNYFSFLQKHTDARLVHWNMNSADFGFRALANRYAYLFGEEAPSHHSDHRKIDLDDVVTLGYGHDFADHPKLKSIGLLNGFHFRHFLTGAEEADRFKKDLHGDIRRSVTEKTSLISRLTRLLLDGTLETKHSGQRLDFAGSSLDSVKVVLTVGERSREVRRQLKRRHSNRHTLEVNDEYDAQDLMHSLLRLFFDDVRREEWTPSYAGSASRIDFVLPRYRLAIELKHAGRSLSTKDLGEQLIVDANKYKKHANVRHLVCLVFDEHGSFENPRGVESDLSHAHDGLAVTVRIYDH